MSQIVQSRKRFEEHFKTLVPPERLIFFSARRSERVSTIHHLRVANVELTISCFWIFSPSSEFLRPVQHYQPLLPCRIQHHHDGLRHLRDTVYQETAGLQPEPGALHGGKREHRPLRDAGEVHIRLQVLLLVAVFLQRGRAAARLRGFYGNIAERERSRERGMMRKGHHLHCSCQAYAGYFYVARALLVNGTSEMQEFSSSIRQFCQTPWEEVRFYSTTEQPLPRSRQQELPLHYETTAFIALWHV